VKQLVCCRGLKILYVLLLSETISLLQRSEDSVRFVADRRKHQLTSKINQCHQMEHEVHVKHVLLITQFSLASYTNKTKN